jgi:hypothetical protein
VDKFFKTLTQLASSSEFFTHQARKQLTQSTEIVSERKKKTSPSWRVGLYFYSPSLNSTCELVSGYPHLYQPQTPNPQNIGHSHLFSVSLSGLEILCKFYS